MLQAKINNRKRKVKEEKKENGDLVDENTEKTAIEGEQAEKRARVDEPENITPVAEQNGTEELEESVNADEDSDIQEVKVNTSIIEIADEQHKIESEETEVVETDVAETDVAETDMTEAEPIRESPAPATKTTPARNRGGRGRGGTARRGRSSR